MLDIVMTSPAKLCPSSLGAHDRRTQRQSQQSVVSSWVASQSEQLSSTDTNVSCGFVEDTKEQDTKLTTPAIVLTTPDEDESLAKELVAPQFYPQSHHATLSTHSTHSQEPERRKPFLCPSLGLVDEPIMEEPEEERERRDVGMKVGEAESLPYLRFSEKSDKPLSFGHNSPDGQGQVPTVMNEPLPEAPTLLLSLHKKRSRTMSYPTDRSAHAIPLLELPSQPKLSQPDASTSEKDVMETSLGKDPPLPANVGKFAHVAVMAKRWKKQAADTTVTDKQQDSKESTSSKQKRRPFVEIPRALKLDLLEEAYLIVNKTYQMYRSELGGQHNLTLQAQEHLDKLSLQLGQQVMKH